MKPEEEIEALYEKIRQEDQIIAHHQRIRGDMIERLCKIERRKQKAAR